MDFVKLCHYRLKAFLGFLELAVMVFLYQSVFSFHHSKFFLMPLGHGVVRPHSASQRQYGKLQNDFNDVKHTWIRLHYADTPLMIVKLTIGVSEAVPTTDAIVI